MRTQHPTGTDTGRLENLHLVPGVVGGLIAAVTDTDDGVSLQIRIKVPRLSPGGCDRVEVLLDAENKEALARALLSSNGPDGGPVRHVPLIRCSVGIGARTRPDD
ncbi:hypothetical protein [Streptomyces sp. NPDC059788]|uniref:hypothetical protein n=1 Tax=Streptomyces sp. NPDC059788 TaxID=3346948 RepID=UPI0036471022